MTRDSEATGAVEIRPPFPTPPSRGGRAWVDPVWGDAPVTWRGSAAAVLAELEAAEPARWLRRIPGRESFVLDAGGGAVVVKRFQGDQSRERWFERLSGIAVRSPGRRECENLRELTAGGFPVPRPLAWFEQGARSAVVMELVAHETTLRAALPDMAAAERVGWGAEVAALVARLHTAGWYHRDLYLEHLVLARRGPSRLALLDVGRARRQAQVRRRWFVKDVAALLHSAPDAVCARERLRLLARYLDERGVSERPARRVFAREVERKARRIAAHAPRFVDGGSPS
jgi:tRNA A-37 threonylcarbamoyl transferase component Bud32